MAVLLEDLSVVVRRSAIDERFHGGWEAFLKMAPQLSLCFDETLVRVAFLHPDLAQLFGSQLESRGLIDRREGKAMDFAVVTDVMGPSMPDWLMWEERITDNGIIAVGFTGANSGELAMPRFWTPTMSEHAVYSPDGAVSAAAGVDRIYCCAQEAKSMAQTMDTMMVEEVADEIFEGVEREYLPAAVAWADGESHHLARSHFVVGVICAILGRDFGAEQAFREALRINSEDIATLLEIARCLERQGKTTEAMIYAADAAIVAPEMPEVWDLLAICFLKCDDAGRAKFARFQNLPAGEAANLTAAIRSLLVKFTDREEESRG